MSVAWLFVLLPKDLRGSTIPVDLVVNSVVWIAGVPDLPDFHTRRCVHHGIKRFHICANVQIELCEPAALRLCDSLIDERLHHSEKQNTLPPFSHVRIDILVNVSIKLERSFCTAYERIHRFA